MLRSFCLAARHVGGRIFHLRGVIASNVYLLDGGKGDRWLIDTGHFAERLMLLFELRRLGLQGKDLTGVLLTHRHSDHAGNAAFLRRQGVRIYAHRADAEVLDGTRPAPLLPAREGTRLARLLARGENLLPTRTPVDRALEEGDVVAGLEVHAVPGHTAGSVFFHHARSGTLLTGDTLLTAVPMITAPGLNLPYIAFTASVTEAHASLARFHAKGVPYDTLLSGHGDPLMGRAREHVTEFLERRGVVPTARNESARD